jgi:DNA polymerase III delta prime subunit
MTTKIQIDWSQKYRPATIADCVLPARITVHLQRMAAQRSIIPTLIFHGSNGIGKSASAHALCLQCEYEPCMVNASLEGGINDLRGLEEFTSTRSMDGSQKVVVIDEAEHLSRDYQDALCGLIERVSSNCSFILTLNDPGKLSAALQSRCTALDFTCPPEEIPALQVAFAARVNEILAAEQAACETGTINEIIEAGFPDFRQILKRVQLECGFCAVMRETHDSGMARAVKSL